MITKIATYIIQLFPDVSLEFDSFSSSISSDNSSSTKTLEES